MSNNNSSIEKLKLLRLRLTMKRIIIAPNAQDKTWGLNDYSCNHKTCPFCDLPVFQQFHLRGACPEQ